MEWLIKEQQRLLQEPTDETTEETQARLQNIVALTEKISENRYKELNQELIKLKEEYTSLIDSHPELRSSLPTLQKPQPYPKPQGPLTVQFVNENHSPTAPITTFFF